MKFHNIIFLNQNIHINLSLKIWSLNNLASLSMDNIKYEMLQILLNDIGTENKTEIKLIAGYQTTKTYSKSYNTEKGQIEGHRNK